MAKYINADEFLKSEIKRCGYEPIIGTCTNDNKSLKEVINDFPSADVQEVKHGKWIDLHDEDVLYEQIYKCSVCGKCFVLETGTPQENEYNYCPNCGAKMDGEED